MSCKMKCTSASMHAVQALLRFQFCMSSAKRLSSLNFGLHHLQTWMRKKGHQNILTISSWFYHQACTFCEMGITKRPPHLHEIQFQSFMNSKNYYSFKKVCHFVQGGFNATKLSHIAHTKYRRCRSTLSPPLCVDIHILHMLTTYK